MDSFDKTFRRTKVAIFIIATIAVCFALTGLIGLPYLGVKLLQHVERCAP